MATKDRQPIYEFGAFRLVIAKRLLTRLDGESIAITPKVFDTLVYLIEQRGTVVEKDEIMNAVWKNLVVEENSLNKNISALRKVLSETSGENQFIATVPGRGYQFVADVKTIEPESSDLLEAAVTGPLNQRNRLFALAAIAGIAIVGLGAYLFFQAYISPEPTGSIRSLAVVPFKPLVPDHRNESLELGMADALISRLSGREELTVRPLSSVRRYSALDADMTRAGNVLNVDAVLDGTIQTWGERIRVSANLSRTSDGHVLWQGQFDERSDDIFALQDLIAARVAGALHSTLSETRQKRPTASVEAYRLYTLGRFHTLRLSPPEIQKGIEYYRQAIDADPAYALAHAGLADSFRTMALISGSPENLVHAKTAAMRAIEIDPRLAEGHAILGFVMFWHDWDWSAAEEEMRLALSYDPNSPDALFALAHLLSNTGRHEEALGFARRASETDPLNMRTVGLEAVFLINAGKPEAALEINKKVRELDPKFWGVHVSDGMAYIEMGRMAEASESAKRARESSRNNAIAISLEGLILVRTGKVAEANQRLDELLKNSPVVNHLCPTALLQAAMGQTDAALDSLELGFERRDPCMTFLKVERKWGDLRQEPRFAELMRKMRFL